jgi:3-phenylpropionate/cinnamic acid dioxygenase small subunit
MRPDELAAREAVRESIARYAHAVDHGKWDAAAACFTEGGVLEIRGVSRDGGVSRHEGRAAVIDMFKGAGRKLASTSTKAFIRHHVSSISIEVDVTAGKASATSYFFVLTEIGPDHWGTYRDLLARQDASGDWLFTERNVSVEGRTAPSRMT